MDAPGKTDLDAFKLFSRRDQPILAVLTDKVGDRLGNIELVGVRIGVLSLLELQDRPGAKFKVLLNKTPVSDGDVDEVWMTHIRVQIVFIRGVCGAILGGRGGRSLFSLPCVLFALLLAALELPVYVQSSMASSTMREIRTSWISVRP